MSTKSSILNLSYLQKQIQTQRARDLAQQLETWADEPDTDRGFCFGKNSYEFKDSKPFYIILLEEGQMELVRGRTREDSIAQALQVIESNKSTRRIKL